MQNQHLPAGVYSLVEQTPAAVLLESASSQDGSGLSRLFLEPVAILAPRDAGECERALEEMEAAPGQGLFAAGFMTYECGGCFEPRTGLRGAGMRKPAAGQPLMWFGIYERCYVWDHRAGRFVGGEPAGLGSVIAAAAAGDDPLAVRVEITEEEYAGRIEAIHEWIRAGDVYQLNFTFPLRFEAPGRVAALYAELRRRQPVEFGAFIHWEREKYVLSYSPELFFRVEQEGERRRITTRPMKGTARRGRTTAEDRDVAEGLRQDAKNRSENVMIVDLLRNDLGRLCEFGSVETQDLFAVERHPTLWQMTSTVSGVLRPEVRLREILRALFPCGSVTGAPKVRAMQIIGEVEGEPRGVYTGAIGYFSREESVCSVAIRTVEMDGGGAKLGVGSGIVIDSDAADEFRECRLKARFVTERPPEFELLESLLWRGGEYPFLELHLDRMEDSAGYFDFRFDRGEVRDRIMAAGAAMPDEAARKVRVLLGRDGGVRIEWEPAGAASGTVRVCIAAERTDAADCFYFHKTTHRPVYARALRAAQTAGFDDVLLLNRDGQVTESALANVFLEKDGAWFTPPVERGLLAGVYRRHVMETRGVRERILTAEDVRAADRVYLTNAVRGMRMVEIDWEFEGDGIGLQPESRDWRVSW
jgi:para-aminobenzoate synthetase/4-amino-4-deoxychorismate lyase